MSATIIAFRRHPDAWNVLKQGLAEHRPVRARYHDLNRLLCPHVLGWKDGRAKVLSFQAGGNSTNGSPLSRDPRQRWRTMFVDEILDVELTDETWETADNYGSVTNGIDLVEVAVGMPTGSLEELK
jgi:hypothetical protein